MESHSIVTNLEPRHIAIQTKTEEARRGHDLIHQQIAKAEHYANKHELTTRSVLVRADRFLRPNHYARVMAHYNSHCSRGPPQEEAQAQPGPSQTNEPAQMTRSNSKCLQPQWNLAAAPAGNQQGDSISTNSLWASLS
ncbi:hypothetical protein HGRIS_005997 [Hohenbuehelia grisea]|uniref:Uncharacterized protein n=1 Tax=Hohenbuehelia grisea TaxID=104357 RepID=A0ABR3JZM5_9AGAR